MLIVVLWSVCSSLLFDDDDDVVVAAAVAANVDDVQSGIQQVGVEPTVGRPASPLSGQLSTFALGHINYS